ncbi:MAG: Rpn family recombination-promoting nuclease/putative transposase [Spirochaetaceae bacterium]|jgi:hypothetical protein|nr:Rpn family recombination-promoting nuclease/putative transposase [Spirochaetaceae bacterium]
MNTIYLDETDDPVNICYDNVFKAVFTRGTPESQAALSGLVSAITGRSLSVLSITANEPPVYNIRDRQIRFDIPCKAVNGELVNIEMSLNPDTFELVRLEKYSCGRALREILEFAEKARSACVANSQAQRVALSRLSDSDPG